MFLIYLFLNSVVLHFILFIQSGVFKDLEKAYVIDNRSNKMDVKIK